MTEETVFVVCESGRYLAESSPVVWTSDLRLAAHYATAGEAQGALDIAKPYVAERLEIQKVMKPSPPSVGARVVGA